MKLLTTLMLCTILALTFVIPAKAQNSILDISELLLENTTYSMNMTNPWGFTFIADDEIVYTEKVLGTVWKLNLTTKQRNQITGGPVSLNIGQGGLLDVVAHPNFEVNGYIYFTYAKSEGSAQTTAMGRGKLVGNTIQNYTELFRALPTFNSGQHFGSKLVFDNDGYLFMSVGDRGTGSNAQILTNYSGKVLRFNDDGTIPNDNPFVAQQGAKGEIYSYGHRNIQGMALNPITGIVWAHEHGPQGGDELNIVKKGANFGWPLATFGEQYGGGEISPDTSLPGMEDPITYWVPSIAPSGMAFIRSSQNTNEVDIILGALAGQHIHRLLVRNDKVVKATKSFSNQGRVRDVRVAPNGKIYALYEGPGKLIEISSATERCSTFIFSTIGNSMTIEGFASIPNAVLSYDLGCDNIDVVTVPIPKSMNSFTVNNLAPGTYCVKVDAKNASNVFWCEKNTAVLITATSVIENKTNEPYPNPVTSLLSIPESIVASGYVITSVLGERILQNDATNRQIDVTSIPTGTYFLTISHTNGKTSTHRFVKM